jgi:hypothetical protein
MVQRQVSGIRSSSFILKDVGSAQTSEAQISQRHIIPKHLCMSSPIEKCEGPNITPPASYKRSRSPSNRMVRKETVYKLTSLHLASNRQTLQVHTVLFYIYLRSTTRLSLNSLCHLEGPKPPSPRFFSRQFLIPHKCTLSIHTLVNLRALAGLETLRNDKNLLL